MKILVTGGAGFIGSNLAKRLEQDGHAVTILDNFFSADFRNLVGFTGEVITADCSSDLPIPTTKFDAIFHEASITDTTVLDQAFMMKNNADGFKNILAWAKTWNAKVIWASSASIYGNGQAPNRESDPPRPLNVYAYSKHYMELMAKRWNAETSIPVTGLRYFNVYGPGEKHKGKFASMIYQLAQQMKAGKRPRLFKFGEQKRDFVCVQDVIQANLLALKANITGVFNAGSGHAASFNETIAALNKTLNLSLEPDYFDNPYAFTQDHTEADESLATSILGYKPQYTITNGIEYYQQTGAL